MSATSRNQGTELSTQPDLQQVDKTAPPAASLTGWLLDVYAAPLKTSVPAGTDASTETTTPEKLASAGVVAWLLGEDGLRHRLTFPFPVTFYANGTIPQLRELWRFLRRNPTPVIMQLQKRRELFSPEPLTVLAVQVAAPALLDDVFRQVSRTFPNLTYFDADLAVHLRCAARWGIFPLAYCQIIPGEKMLALDTPWDLEPAKPPLRSLILEPDTDPDHARPSQLLVKSAISKATANYRLSLQPARALLINLTAILKRSDPDLILTSWGDSWLMPLLLEYSEQLGLALPLNRDTQHIIVHRPERSYFSYGQVIYRDRQVHLFGRWHIDRRNATLWDDYTLDGVLETARVTALPVQTAARTSPGTGISNMQMLTALRQEVLVPWRKAEPERFKQAGDLFAADQGGMVYQPTVGLHRDVAEIDFVSMYPGIMVRFNISPETAGNVPHRANELAPIETPERMALPARSDNEPPEGMALPAHSDNEPPEGIALPAHSDYEPPEGIALPAKNENKGTSIGNGSSALKIQNSLVNENFGLVPQTLAPLLQKRLELKACLGALPARDPRRGSYKERASAHKWLLVTCFGYLGYRNARFGRIEAHEAVTAYGREALLRAKEAAEDQGFNVLHMFVDGLWVQREDAHQVADFQSLLVSITARTGLPISLDGIFRWIAFLPSRVDERVPVPTRYFGVFQDGSLKVRGIEARRRDTPPFISDTQMKMLEILAQAPDVDALPDYLPKAHAHLQRTLYALRQGRIPFEKLLAGLKLSRELEQYRTPSPAARAARQLLEIGKVVRPGERVRLLYLRGEPDVHAWDLPYTPDPQRIDVAMYTKLMLRAAENVLIPLGGKELLYPVLQPALPEPRKARRVAAPAVFKMDPVYLLSN